MSRGTEVYYLTGNHDDVFRRYSETSIGNFHLLDKLVLNIDGKNYWIFHGDVFDITMKNSKWLAKLGSTGYDLLILLNRSVNYLLRLFGQERISFSKRIKNSVKRAVQFISDFEKTVISLALENGYDYVVCGHIHQPEIREVNTVNKRVTYMNSGDWIENLTTLEYSEGRWRLHTHEETTDEEPEEETDIPESILVLHENIIRHTMHG